MKVTQEHLDFVAECIANGEDVGPNAVRVDVSLIVERFSLPWPTARNLLQSAAKKLGHSMIGPKSTKVTKTRKQDKQKWRQEPLSRRGVAAIDALMNKIRQENVH